MDTNKINNAVKAMEELQKAKHAVQYCLDNPNGLCDFHGLKYWAERVEELREQVRELL